MGFRQILVELREVEQMFEMSCTIFFVTVALPSASVDIMARVRIALALIFAVVPEMETSPSGIRYDNFLARYSYRSANLYAGLVVIGLAIVQCVILVEHRLFA